MAYIHDLDYYGGNANNQRHLESLAAAEAAPTPTTTTSASPAHASRIQEIAAAQALLAQLQSDSAPDLTDAQQVVPVPPATPPTWKAKA